GCNLSRIGNTTCSCLRSRFPLPLVVHIKERLVLHDRAAKRPAKLVVVKWILSPGRIEKVAGTTNRAGSVVFQEGSAQAVSAALGHNVNHGAAVPSVFRFTI